MFEVFFSQKYHQLWTFRPSQQVISKDLVTSFSRKKRKKIEKFEKSMIFGCFLTFLASIIIVESLKTIKHPKTVWIWRKNHFSNYFDKKNVPIKKTVTDAFFYRQIIYMFFNFIFLVKQYKSPTTWILNNVWSSRKLKFFQRYYSPNRIFWFWHEILP